MLTRVLIASALLAGAALPTLSRAETHAAAPAAPAALAAGLARGPEYGKLLADKASALVTIKFLMKLETGGAGDREEETEVTGCMIDPKGLILCTNLQMGGVPPQFARRMGNFTLTPTKIKILIGEDTEGVDAKLIARDSDLDLAWVRIDRAADKPYNFVDFSKSADGKLGDNLLILDRLGKLFDRAPVVTDVRVGAVIRKPRHLLYPSGVLSRYGAPVFSEDLKSVGFAVIQTPSAEDEEADNERGDGRQLVILPAADVVSATDRALKTAAEGGGAAVGGGDAKDKDGKDEQKPAEVKKDK